MEEFRSYLVLYAYNIIGSFEGAKDIVQETFLKFSQVDKERIADPKSYLVRMVINLSIDEKRKQKSRLNRYPGPWLPEPVATDDPQAKVYKKEILRYSMMVLLERLDARQRAVFILKEAFDYEHEDIAKILGTTPENSRKILSRARNELRRTSAGAKLMDRGLLDQYLSVIEAGDIRSLEQLLHSDITVMSDGGGKATAFRKVIVGRKAATALLFGLHKKNLAHVEWETAFVNHQPAIFYFSDGNLVTVQIFSFSGPHLDHVFFIRNPDKLSALRETFSNRVTLSPTVSSLGQKQM